MTRQRRFEEFSSRIKGPCGIVPVTKVPCHGLTTLEHALEGSRVYAQDPIRAWFRFKRMRKRKELLKYNIDQHQNLCLIVRVIC